MRLEKVLKMVKGAKKTAQNQGGRLKNGKKKPRGHGQ